MQNFELRSSVSSTFEIFPVAVEDFELRVLHPVQQHVHAGQVVGGDVLLLAVDLADGARKWWEHLAPLSLMGAGSSRHPLAHVQQQGAGAAGKVHHAFQALLRAGFRFLTVQRDDGGEDVGNLLRGVKLARLLAGPGGKLANQVFIGIVEQIEGNSVPKFYCRTSTVTLAAVSIVAMA